jgi:hypothetical protein
MIGKGLSSPARARLLQKKWLTFSNPVALSLDASKFDQHVNRELLAIEHMFYLLCNGDPEFQQLLSWQLDSRGRTIGSDTQCFKYNIRGRRCSGDMNTAAGNCLLTCAMAIDFMEWLGTENGSHIRYELLDDGDDCLLIIESADLDLVVKHVQARFLSYGMVLKIEGIAHSLSEIEWCQSHVVIANGSPTFVRDPRKVLATALTGVKYFADNQRRPLVNTIGLAELALNAGVPVLQSYAEALVRNAATDRITRMSAQDSLWWRVHRDLGVEHMQELASTKARPITQEARQSFQEAFGIDIDAQLLLEEQLAKWTFPLEGTREAHQPWLAPWLWDISQDGSLHPLGE